MFNHLTELTGFKLIAGNIFRVDCINSHLTSLH